MSFQDVDQTTTTVANAFPTYDAKTLTGSKGQAYIVLDDKVYTLRVTRAGKLILTK